MHGAKRRAALDSPVREAEGSGKHQPLKELPMEQTNGKYQITLDDDIIGYAKEILKLQEAQKAYDGFDDEWQDLNEQIKELRQDIGFYIVWDLKHAGL